MNDIPRILIVDDDESTRRTLALIFRRKGYAIETAGLGQEALEKARADSFNVALLDIQLPDIQGVELLKPLREMHPDIALIMITGHASVETAARALNNGASAYITKPLSVDEVLAKIREVLEKQRLLWEKRRAEEALRKSEQRYRTLAEGIPLGLYRTTPEGRILYANPSLVKMLGYPDRESMMQVNVYDLYVEPEDRRREQSLLQRKGDVHVFETQLRREDETNIWVRDTVRVGHDVRGRAVYYEGILEDITARKQMEEQIQRQERLAAVGRLAGGIAHDFNNYLTTIILYGHLLLNKSHLSPDLAVPVETIIHESKQAANLVEQILDFSRRSSMKTSRIDLVSFTEEVVAILRRMLPENIHISLDAPSGQLPMQADPARMQQMLMNLATNARDAMPMGGELGISLSQVVVEPNERLLGSDVLSGRWVCLTVSDTGTGMTEEVKEHLFEPFFTTKEPGKGTGLGLAQVYGIISQHGGFIDVQTELKKGSVFRIYLPACERQEAVAEKDDAPHELWRGKGETILLVEDEERIRSAAQAILESANYRVLTAGNGKDALQVYRSAKRVDLVVTDVVMPEMGGAELISALRKEVPQLKAMAITGYGREKVLLKLERLGVLEVLMKPFNSHTLTQAIRRVLDGDDEQQ